MSMSRTSYSRTEPTSWALTGPMHRLALSLVAALALAGCEDDAASTTKPADVTVAPDVQDTASGATDAVADSGTTDAGGKTDAASGGTDATAGTDAVVADPIISIDNLEAEFVAAFCENQTKCGGMVFAEPKSCAAVMGPQLGLAPIIAGVKSSSIKYDGKEAAKCVAAIKSDCGALAGGKPALPCVLTFKGTVAVGQSCQLNQACLTGYCIKSTSGNDCPGTCGATVGSGSDCEQSTQCSDALVCSGGKCGQASAPAPGADCGEGQSCGASAYCAYDNTAGKPICMAKAALGSSCSVGSNSCVGSYCKYTGDNSQGEPQGTCTALVKSGQKCDPMSAGLGSDGGGGLQVCEGELKCVAGEFFSLGDGSGGGSGSDIPDVFVCGKMSKPGEACVGPFSCLGLDSWCKGATANKAGVCTLLPKKGEACEAANPAAGLFESCFGENLVCNPVGKCAEAPIKGQPCYQGQCNEGLYCSAGLCAGPSKLGETCDSTPDNQCDDGLTCTAGKCAKAACK